MLNHRFQKLLFKHTCATWGRNLQLRLLELLILSNGFAPFCGSAYESFQFDTYVPEPDCSEHTSILYLLRSYIWLFVEVEILTIYPISPTFLCSNMSS